LKHLLLTLVTLLPVIVDATETGNPSNPSNAEPKATEISAEPTDDQHSNKNPCDDQQPTEESSVEKAQYELFSLSCEAALWLDGIGSNRGSVTAAKRTNGYVETSVEYSEFDGFSSDTKMRVDTELPILQRRLRAFVGRERNDNSTRKRSESFALQSQFENNAQSGSWLVGLGYSVPGLERFKTDVSVGVSGLPDVEVYVNSQSRFTALSTDEQLMHLSFKPFWTNQSGFGLTFDEDFSLVVKEGLLLRFLQINTISERTGGLDWYVGTILYQKLSYERGLAWQLFARGQTDEPEPLTNYGVQVAFRTPIIKNRLNSELRLGVGFPRVDPDVERKSSGNISINFILPFGRAEKE